MLYLVPTPIGNLGDMSPRALQCLEEADFIAAEDTRVSIKLLNYFEIKKPLVPYHRHNTQSSGPEIVEKILRGKVCALVCDAGTPAISDPGEELVKLCVEKNISVVAIPGACAVTTALSVSGIETGRFCFEGFLAMNKKNRRNHLEELRYETRTMIFYEAPHKLKDTLRDMADYFGGNRKIALCRELTKKHEEVLRFTLEEAVEYYNVENPRGEYVLVISGGEKNVEALPTLEDALEEVNHLLEQGESMRDAVKMVANTLKLSRNQLYKLATQQREDEEDEGDSTNC